MSTVTQIIQKDAREENEKLLANIIIKGDLSGLSEAQKVMYYKSLCEVTGLNPLTRPLEYMRLNGKLIVYARKEASDQLRKRYNVSLTITARELNAFTYTVAARATMPDGRCDESIGVVSIENLKGADLANAFMKAETKAKRRVTFSITGFGALDETEVETIQ